MPFTSKTLMSTSAIKIFTEMPTHQELLSKYKLVIHIDSDFSCMSGIDRVGVPIIHLGDMEVPGTSFFAGRSEVGIVIPRMQFRTDVPAWMWKFVPHLPHQREEVLIIVDCYSSYDRCDCFTQDETQREDTFLLRPFDHVILPSHGDACELGNNQAHRIFDKHRLTLN